VWLRTARLSVVARGVDARLPQLQGALETAVDLSKSLAEPGNKWSSQTRELATRQLDESATRALAVSASELLPLRDLGRATLIGPLALALALFAVNARPHSPSGALWALFGPVQGATATTEGSEPEVVADLALRNITIRLHPPAYSKRETVVLDATSGDFRALPGTRVEMEADLSSPGVSVEVHWLGEMLMQAPVQGSRLTLAFTSPGGGSYQILLDRGGGRSVLHSRRFRVEALPDDPPRLEVHAPADLEVRPKDTLRLELRVSDDFALSRLERVISRNGREVSRASWAEVDGAPQWNGELTWMPFEDLGDRGGKMQLVVEAFDNDTVNGPKVTRSRPLRVYVPTERDQHQQVLRLKQLLLEQGIDLLAPMLLAAVADDEPDKDALLAEFDSQRRLAMSFFEVAGKLAEAGSKDRFEKRRVFLGIGQLVENFARRFRGYEEFIESELRHQKSPHLYGSTLEGLAMVRGAAITELEQVLTDLSAFVELHRGEDVYEKVSGAEAALSSLSDLLRDGVAGKPVQKDLQEALARLAEQLRELSNSLAERSRGPNDSFQNKLPQDLGNDLLRKVSELIAEGRYGEALDLLRQAMDAAAALRGALDQEQQMAGGQQAEQLQAQMREAIAEARALEERQEALLESTRKLKQRYGDGEPMAEKERARLVADLDELLERISALPPTGLPPRTTGSIRQRARLAHGLTEDMGQAWLREGDLNRAIERGEVAVAYLESMKDDLVNMPDGFQQGREHANSRISEASGLAGQIVARLQQGMRRASGQQSKAGRAGEGTRAKQDQLRGDVGRLRARLENRSGLGGGAYNPIAGRESLEAAGQLMGGASSGLRQGRLGQAMRSEQGALEQLKGFRESLEASQQAMQSSGGMGAGMMARRGGQRGQGDPWQRLEGLNGDSSGGEVELPDPADFVTPEAFRSLVQEGAVGDAPSRYRPMNSSYYEELLR